ncbi:MAG: FemAB family PEP-CTERM system-associated protein [Gammaproteobacteria bacterium]|nr:FemAB family PEP-CTERM system-associated protein [Gammaproteobacteria bacterium]
MKPTADTVLEISTPLHEKQILANPAELFLTHWPDDTETLDTIRSLLQQRQLLERQQKTAQNKTGILSRQIGEAKSNNQATDKLIASMQTLSTKRKTLNKQSKQINQDILHYFAQQTRSGDQKKAKHNNNTNNQRYLSTAANIETIHIEIFDADNMEDWNQYVTAHPASTIHHHAEWRHILRQSYGHENLYLCARNNDQRIVGILPLVHIKSRLFGDKLVSMPFFQRGGAIADTPEIELKLIQAAANYSLQMKVDYTEFRDDTPRDRLPEPCATQTHKVNMVLALPDSKQTLWQDFTAKLRAQIRRPQRESCQVFIGGQEYLNDFYAVYSRNMCDLGSPVQSKQFIKNILQQFPQNSWLIIIKLDQRPVSAGFLLGFKHTMEIPLASTIRDVNPLSINMLLYWEVLKFAIKQNYSQFDFGRSSKNAGTYRFKQQWGAQPKQLYWHYYLGQSQAPPSLSPSNPKYAAIIKIWKRLPLPLANFLGPAIVKNIP